MIASKLLVGYLNCGGLGARNPPLEETVPISWDPLAGSVSAVCQQAWLTRCDLVLLLVVFEWRRRDPLNGLERFFGNWLNPEFLHLEKIHPISLYDIFSDGLKMLKPPTRKGNKNNQRYQRWFFAEISSCEEVAKPTWLAPYLWPRYDKEFIYHPS